MARLRKQPWFQDMLQRLRDQRAERKSRKAEMAEFEEVTQNAGDDRTSGRRSLPSKSSKQDNRKEHIVQKSQSSEKDTEGSGAQEEA